MRKFLEPEGFSEWGRLRARLDPEVSSTKTQRGLFRLAMELNDHSRRGLL